MRTRRTQTVAVFALTVLAALSASAAPWFLAWGPGAVTGTDLGAAPIAQRVVTVTGSAAYRAGDPSPLPLLRTRVQDVLSIPGADATTGGAVMAVAGPSAAGGATTAVQRLAAREDVCAQLTIEGACPAGDHDVIITRPTAARLKVGVGDPLRLTSFPASETVVFRVVGVYDPKDATSPYWAATKLLAGPFGQPGADSTPTAFVTEEALLSLGSRSIDVDYHMVVPADAFRDGGATLRRQLREASDRLNPDGFAVATTAGTLIDAVGTDRGRFRDAVGTAALELVLLSWFALFLVVRQTSVLRRTDLGLLKLHGGPKRQIAAVVGQQSAIPMVAGVVLGALLGGPTAALLAGSSAALRPAAFGATVAASAVAAAVVGVGALLVALVAEASALRAPVLALLRRIPRRASGWRAPAADLAVVALALAGVYQGHAELAASGRASALALAAPALVGLAVAVVVARALPWIAARTGTRALAAGRPEAALGALHVARRPGTERVFLVMAVAVSVMATTVFFGASARAAWADRARLELGADRVLVVAAPDSAALLADVRAADPSGRYAMAVAYDTLTRTLAVDTTRLAATMVLSPAHGLPDAADLARRLRPTAPGAPVLRDGPLDADLAATAGAAGPLFLRLAYADATGQERTTDLGPLAAGRRAYHATIDGCPAGCRLVSVEPVTARPAATVSMYGVDQPGGTLTGAVLADIRHWRSQLGPDSAGPLIAAGDGRLDISVTSDVPPGGKLRDNRVYYAATPVPVPVVMAGPDRPGPRPGDPRITALGALDVSYTEVAHARALPAAGADGTLVDLEYAQDSIGATAESVVLEVWLRADTPPGVVRALRASGVAVLSDTDLAGATSALGRHGSGVALRFQLFVAAVVLLLATGSLVVTVAVQRRDRAAELGALRAQGLTARAMRRAGYGATVPVVVAAVLTGITSALIAQWSAASSLPVFADDWSVLARPAGASAAPVALAVGAAALALVPAAWLGTARMIRSVDRSSRRES